MSDPVPEDDGTPNVTCSRCDETWDLSYELDEIQVGNRAVEKFALDHRRHTGHFPDGISPWLADCTQCPDSEQFLSEDPARRWAETHARHTRHEISLRHDPSNTEETVSKETDGD